MRVCSLYTPSNTKNTKVQKMNFTFILTIFTVVSSAIIPQAKNDISNVENDFNIETDFFDIENMDQELINEAVENLESLLKMSIDKVQNLSDEEFDQLLDQAFYSLESKMK